MYIQIGLFFLPSSAGSPFWVSPTRQLAPAACACRGIPTTIRPRCIQRQAGETRQLFGKSKKGKVREKNLGDEVSKL